MLQHTEAYRYAQDVTAADRFVGDTLYAARQSIGYTSNEAIREHILAPLGISWSYYQKIERGRSRPSESYLRHLAQHLNIDRKTLNRMLEACGYEADIDLDFFREQAKTLAEAAGANSISMRVTVNHGPKVVSETHIRVLQTNLRKAEREAREYDAMATDASIAAEARELAADARRRAANLEAELVRCGY